MISWVWSLRCLLVGLHVSPPIPWYAPSFFFSRILTRADGMSGIFWLFLNWGQLFSSPRKIGLTIVNVITVGIGAALVCIHLSIHRLSSTNVLSVVLAYTSPAKQFTMIALSPASRVLSVHLDGLIGVLMTLVKCTASCNELLGLVCHGYIEAITSTKLRLLLWYSWEHIVAPPWGLGKRPIDKITLKCFYNWFIWQRWLRRLWYVYVSFNIWKSSMYVLQIFKDF